MRVNGYGPTKEHLFISLEGDAAPNGSQASTTSHETTRYLAAATQIDTKYAAEVVGIVFGEPLKALAPSYGIEVAVVAKWALKALRTQAVRDLILAPILILQALSIALSIMVSAWFLTAPLALSFVAWIVVSWEYWERMHKCVRGQLLRDRFASGKAPPAKRPSERKQLQDLADRTGGNLTVFSGSSAFVGTGETTDHRRILFDISFRKESGNEEAAGKEEDFTSHDIHRAIMDAFSRTQGLGKSLTNIRAYERLFVNGRHLRAGTNLLPDSLRPPCTTVTDDVLAAAAINPTEDSRSYVCVEIPGWHGQLVVTLFARAIYTRKSLFVEWTFRVLPPLREKFLEIDDYFELPRFQQAVCSLSAGLRRTAPTLLRSPAAALGSILRTSEKNTRRRRLEYAIPHGYVYDYGAARSIREDASNKYNKHLFLARDEKMYMLLTQQTLIQAVRSFLHEHGVELATFDRQVQYITHTSINIGEIKDSAGIAVGTSPSANVNSTPGGSSE